MAQLIKSMLPSALRMMHNYKDVVSQAYFNSAVVVKYDNEVRPNLRVPITFTLDDVIATCAFAGTPVALIGSTGSGKSYLADVMAHCLFGSNFGEKTINPDLKQMDFIDPAYKKMLESETKEEYIKPDPLLQKPCIVLNELNRTPSILQNFFLGLLEKKVNLSGVNFNVGVKLDSGSQYCFILTTMNEGAPYSGTSDVDLALRNRLGIELFIDNYDYNEDGSTARDLLNLIRNNSNHGLVKAQSGHSNTIFNIFSNINSIELDIDSILFLQYLNWMNKCIKSEADKSKRSIPPAELVNLCTGCGYAKEHKDVCRNFYRPSNRALKSLASFAKAISFMKTVKTLDYCTTEGITFDLNELSMEVTLEDMLAAAPFVLADKTEMNKTWLYKQYQGNKIYACRDISNFIKGEIIESKKIMDVLNKGDAVSTAQIEAFKKKRLGPDIVNFLKEYIEDE